MSIMNENFTNNNKFNENYLLENFLITDEAALLQLQSLNNSQQSLLFNENNLDITNYQQQQQQQQNYLNPSNLLSLSSDLVPPSSFIDSPASSNASTPLSYGLTATGYSPSSIQDDLSNHTFSPITPLDNLRTNSILNPNNIYQYLSKSQSNVNTHPHCENVFHDNLMVNNVNNVNNLTNVNNINNINNIQNINSFGNYQLNFNASTPQMPQTASISPAQVPDNLTSNSSFQFSYSPTQALRTYQNTEDIIAHASTFNSGPMGSSSPLITNMTHHQSKLLDGFPVSQINGYTTDQFYPLQYQLQKNSISNASKKSIIDGSTSMKNKSIVQLMKEHPKIWEVANKFKIKKGAYKCTHCELSFLTQAEFAKHLDDFAIERLHKCPEPSCPYRFIGLPRRADLRRHAESHGYKLPNATNTDSLEELAKKDIKIALSHATTKRKKGNICPVCKNILGRKDSLTRHINLCHKNQNSRYNKKIRKELEKKREEEKKIELLKKYSKCNIMTIPGTYTRNHMANNNNNNSPNNSHQ